MAGNGSKRNGDELLFRDGIPLAELVVGDERWQAHKLRPPPASEVPGLMADLARLLQYESEGVVETSVLMRAAIVHAQFEAIHPFLDGTDEPVVCCCR